MFNDPAQIPAGGSRHEFDLLTLPARPRLTLHRATPADITEARELAAAEIPGQLAGHDVIADVIGHNANSILLFRASERLAGFWSMLHLNARGLESLLLGELTLGKPPRSCLSRPSEAPAATYVWAVVAPGLAAEGIRHAAVFMRQPLYAGTNLYSRPNTPIGVRLNVGLGFAPQASGVQGLYRYVRLSNRAQRPDRQAA